MKARNALTVLLLLALRLGVAAGEPPLPPITRGPYLQALLDTSVLIVWKSRDPVLGSVECWRPGEDPRLMAGVERGLLHRFQLDGLSPGSVYQYRVLHDAAAVDGEPLRFRTAPPAGQGTIRVAVVGDSGTASVEQLAVAEVIRSIAPEIFLHTGDVDYMSDFDFSVFGPYRDILKTACFYPVSGNHDIFMPWDEAFFPPGGNPPAAGARFYSFDWGPAHFTAIESESFLEEAGQPAAGPQTTWLKADLAAARASGIPWKVVYLHRPPFTVGAYGDNVETIRLRVALTRIISDHGVDLVLTGHDHNYQRSYPVLRGPRAADLPVVRDAWQNPHFVFPRGTIYLVTGGGGHVLYNGGGGGDRPFIERFRYRHHAVELEISPTVLKGWARAPRLEPLQGVEVIDEFTIRKEGERPPFRFLRGDTDGNGTPEIADAIQILSFLFLGGRLRCLSTADVNRSGQVDITDPIALLSHLFLGDKPPPPPYPACGVAPEEEDAFCYVVCDA